MWTESFLAFPTRPGVQGALEVVGLSVLNEYIGGVCWGFLVSLIGGPSSFKFLLIVGCGWHERPRRSQSHVEPHCFPSPL